MAGTIGTAGAGARDAGFGAPPVGVTLAVVGTLLPDGTELGVVGDVDGASSEGWSCVEGVSDPVTVEAEATGWAAPGVGVGTEAAVWPADSGALSRWSTGGMTSSSWSARALRFRRDLGALEGKGWSGRDSHGSYVGGCQQGSRDKVK
jgi:hypothetical protein